MEEPGLQSRSRRTDHPLSAGSGVDWTRKVDKQSGHADWSRRVDRVDTQTGHADWSRRLVTQWRVEGEVEPPLEPRSSGSAQKRECARVHFR
uniref:Uncharacterized protein n=1 Tax=Knipowitschia caucasica TaxID=637954 RepID=A0AAV2JA76_KNICA